MNADGTVPEDNPFPGSINLIRAGANYGWPTVEGTSTDDRFTNPVLQWRPAEASPSAPRSPATTCSWRPCAASACGRSR